MKNPKISIIVPVYKVEQYLPLCVDSILNQTFSDFELLLVNDGSPDRSVEICEEYAKNDSRVKVFHKENGGVSSARNLGINKAKGEWIYFADADDELKKNGLEILYRNIGNDIDFVMAGYEICDEECNIIDFDIKLKTETISSKETISYMFRPIDYAYHGYLWTKLFRRSIIIDNSLSFNTQISFNEDRLFIIEYLCSQTKNCVYTTKPVYKYYKRPTGAMSSLEKGFNYKFLTDLEAYVMMYKSLVAKGDKHNSLLAKEGIYESHMSIKKMALKFGVKDDSITPKIDNILYDNVSWFYRSFFFIKNIYRKFKHKFQI